MKQRTENIHYGHPDLRFSHLVFYIVRKCLNSKGVIQPDEWISYVNESPDLFLDEIYPQYNINRECWETWREIGRVRWQAPDEVVHFHFRPPGIGYVGLHRQMDLKTETQRNRLLKALPEHPTLGDWTRVVETSRYMVPADDPEEPGKAWWIGKNGRKKVMFSWMPPAVWMYQMPASEFYNDPPLPDPVRKIRCEALAHDLDAVVEVEP